MSNHAHTRLLLAALVGVVGLAPTACDPALDPPAKVIVARFDPDAKVIPMPSDVLRDDATGHLKTPVDDATNTPAERALYQYLNTLDGWSSASTVTVELSAPISPASLTADRLQIWKWGPTPTRLDGLTMSVIHGSTKVAIDAPRTGWERGATYVAVLRGGTNGVVGESGEKVECDAAFYFLRQTQRLDTPEHNDAFPGNTFAERASNAKKLEDIRVQLAPHFDFFAARGLPRDEVAALWRFTVTTRVELAMDKASQRMPIPMQLLMNPATGKVDLPRAAWDSDVEAEAKHRLGEYDGFSTSGTLLFEFTGPVDATTVTDQSVQLWTVDGTPARVPATATLMADKLHVLLTPTALPLAESARFAVAVTDAVKDATGKPVVAMPAGALLLTDASVFDGKASLVGAVEDEDAVRLEAARTMLTPVVPKLDHAHLVTAWPFQTQTVAKRLEGVVATAATLGLPTDPTVLGHKSAVSALLDFPLGVGSLLNIGDVVEGTVPSADFLDPVTRARRADGSHVANDVHFTATIPRGLTPGQPVPVMIFGHGVMTERRFVLAIGDALARKGIAAIAIDLPYHGTRTRCVSSSPISVVNPQTGKITSLPPCQSGSTCSDDGRCVDSSGNGNHLSQWPILNYPIASGAAFLEIDHIANTKDHFDQAVVDLGALLRSLRTGHWDAVFGGPVDPARVYYAGQSLGGILGATFLAVAPEIDRAVLNVPGADLVPMFADSTIFGPQLTGFFTRQAIVKGSFEEARFLAVGHWLMDAVDPLGLGQRTGARHLMLQMATLDIIIPNPYTKDLQAQTHAPRRDYIAEHGFLVIPIEPEYLRGVSELASFLAGELQP
jgi:dienelactone hydrolase